MKTNKSRRGSFGSSEAEGDRVQDRLQGDRRREDPRSAQNAGTGAVSQKAEHAEPGWEGGSRKGGPNTQMRCAPTSTTHVENRSQLLGTVSRQTWRTRFTQEKASVIFFLQVTGIY